MKTLLVALLLGASAIPAHAQATSASLAMGPAVDTAAEREALRKFTTCVADKRPRWARALLAKPYLSTDQADDAAVLISGKEGCQKRAEVTMTFRTSTVVGALAEHYLQSNLQSVDQQRLTSALATIAPLNSSEDFALCVASRNPSAALDLIRSSPGGDEETRAATIVATAVPSCTKPEERLDVDLQSIRSLVATALYRATTQTRS